MHSRHPIVVCVCAVLLGTVIVTFIVIAARSTSQASDASLINNFKSHEPQFKSLATMYMQDSHILMIRDSVVSIYQDGATNPYVYLNKGKTWPASEVELNFSELRWEYYRDAFRKLGLRGGMERTSNLPGTVFFEAAVKVSELDNDERAVITKGYAYIPGNIEANLRDNLDDIKVDRPATFYKKIQDQWYLYYQWSVSKPE